jgi:haloacetate dehalogenase
MVHEMLDLFPGWAERRMKTAGAEVCLRTAGSGPPLKLLAGYPQKLQEPRRVHANSADDRTGTGIDRRPDAADRKAGRTIGCSSVIVWGSHYLGKRGVSPLEVWRARCSKVSAAEIDCGHFLTEENPQALRATVRPFLTAQGAAR